MKEILISVCILFLASCELEEFNEPNDDLMDYVIHDTESPTINEQFVQRHCFARTIEKDNRTLIEWDPNWVCTYIDPNLVRELVESGKICEVVGHQWSMSSLYYEDSGLQTRSCMFCGKKQTRTRQPEWGEWR